VNGRSLTAVSVVAAVAAVLAFAAPARAASGCGAAVINAWHNGQLDASFQPACYREALQQLPEDIRIYSSAEDDINRALIASLAKKSAHTAGAVKGVVRKLAATHSASSIRRQAAEAAADPSASAVPLTVLIAGVGAFALIGTASISVLARRLRRGNER
jgi:hypothetical protein